MKSYYWNVRKLLKNTCNGLKLLSYTRSALLPKMNSFTCIFHRLCCNVYVFKFYHVDTAIFAEHLSMFAYDLICLLLLSFQTTVLQDMLSNNHFFSFCSMVTYFKKLLQVISCVILCCVWVSLRKGDLNSSDTL